MTFCIFSCFSLDLAPIRMKMFERRSAVQPHGSLCHFLFDLFPTFVGF